MIINPNKIIDTKIIICDNPEEQIQQNWVDLTIGKIFKLDPDGVNILTKGYREHCERVELEFDELNQVVLEKWEYDIEYWEKFNLPNWVSASVYSRSTLNRGWNFLTSGYFDAWFNWQWWVMLHVNIWTLILEKWVRIWQMVFAKSEEGEVYDGVYNKNSTIN